MSTVIRPCTVDEIFSDPAFNALLAAYKAECCTPGLGPINPQKEMYLAMEQSGMATIFGAFDDDRLVGFAVMLITVVPHYGVPTATTESFFVEPQARKRGIGLHLLRQIEATARDRGATGIFISAPADGQLDQLMEVMGLYHTTNRVHFRTLV